MYATSDVTVCFAIAIAETLLRRVFVHEKQAVADTAPQRRDPVHYPITVDRHRPRRSLWVLEAAVVRREDEAPPFVLVVAVEGDLEGAGRLNVAVKVDAVGSRLLRLLV